MKITIDTELLKDWIEKNQYTNDDFNGMLYHISEDKCKESFIIKREGVRKPKNQGYSEEFEAFWAAYPSCANKTAKGMAWKEWQKLVKQSERVLATPEASLLSLCLSSLAWQKETDKWKQDNGKYICKPENYLKGRMFEDEQQQVTNKKEKYIDMNGIEQER